MEKNEVRENIKKYAKVFFQGVGLFFAYVFHYIAVFAKFVYKHLKKLFKKLRVEHLCNEIKSCIIVGQNNK